ncbi:MAG: hypothetical protein PHO70_01105 [Candidatus Omnitrophica bacterium]|nr:hypothetical protein [Candidatus Omnitrophota bacterium]
MGNSYWKIKNIIKNNKGQNTLEITLVLIIMISLLYGVINVWLWGNKQIVKRQISYNNSRIQAGTAKDVYLEPVWWDYRGKDAIEKLTENQVLIDK